MHSSLVEFVSDVWEAACIIGKLVRTGREHDWKAPHQWVTEHRFSGNKRVVIFRLEVLFPSCSYSTLSNWEIQPKLKMESEDVSNECHKRKCTFHLPYSLLNNVSCYSNLHVCALQFFNLICYLVFIFKENIRLI